MSEPTEEQLVERDEYIAKALRGLVQNKIEAAREAQEMATRLQSEAKRIEQAVKHEEWWRLKAYLTENDIESLCSISPKNLLGE